MTISMNFVTLAPALAPMLAALVALVADVLVPRRPILGWVVAGLGLIAGMVAAGWLAVTGPSEPRTLCQQGGVCFWQVDRAGITLQLVALATAFVVVVLAALERHTAQRREQALARAVMVLTATAGCVGVVAARDLGSWLVLLELATIPGVVLAALTGGARALHGALTLLATMLLSFAVLALGAALWFAATGSFLMTGDAFLAATADADRHPLLVVAVMLLLAGVGFKLSLAPFHAWTPETFAGSGSWVAAFLATTSKVGALGAMLVLLRAASSLGSSALVPVGIAALISMTLGNIMALRSEGMLRFMAWSTVSQAGWVVMPLTVVSGGSVAAAASYLTLYAVGTIAVFVVMAALESADARAPLPSGRAHDVPLSSMRGLFRSHPLLAGTMALGLLSLAGLPPSIVGVVAKIVALKPVVFGGVWWLVIPALVNATLGVAVYLRWIMTMMRPTQDVREDAILPKTPRIYLVVAGLLACALVVTSLAPSLLLSAF